MLKNKTTINGIRFFLLLLTASATLSAAAAGNHPRHGSTVNILLDEWVLQLDTAVVKAGRVTFIAKNQGSEAHEVVIIKTDAKADALPVQQGKVVESKAGKLIGEIEEFMSGQMEQTSFELTPGRYVLFCNIAEREEDGQIESHYLERMHAVLIAE